MAKKKHSKTNNKQRMLDSIRKIGDSNAKEII